MKQAEFVEALAECAEATQAYLREAGITSAMLETCAQLPLTFDQRFAILSQEIREKDAFRIYLEAKRFLHSTALRGYEAVPAS